MKVLPLQPLRVMAACCADAALVVTPDTGPMHLAAAVGVPVVAVLQAKISSRYVPRGDAHRELMKPSVAEVLQAVQAHPAWSALKVQATP